MRINYCSIQRKGLGVIMSGILVCAVWMGPQAHANEARKAAGPAQSDVQQTTVRGIVQSDSGQPIPGATVSDPATGETVATNDQGEFVLQRSDIGSSITVSMIGFRTQEVAVTANQLPAILLEAADEVLDEVVVVGYGTMKKRDLSGSLETVQGKSLTDRGTNQLSQALQGQSAGLMVTKNNGSPGSSATIRVRGITSIGESDPLILVDGIQVPSIDVVNPADVDNISVLKDAASAAIYGSKAAAGVILITTKRGTKGQQAFDVNVTTGLESPTVMADRADVQRYMRMVNELTWNDTGNKPGDEFPVYSQEMLTNYPALHADNPDLYPNTDWVDLILKDRATRNSYLINFSAGSDNLQTRVSVGYDDNTGLYVGKKYNRLTARVNNDIKITDKLKSTVDVSYIRNNFQDPSESPITTMFRAAPIYAAVWSNGMIADGKAGNNIYAQIHEGGFKHRWDNQLSARLSLDFEPIKNFKLTGVVAPALNFNKYKEFRKKVEYTAMDDPGLVIGTTDWGNANRLFEDRADSYNITSQLLANYSLNVGRHAIDAMGGAEHYNHFYETISANSSNLYLNSFPYLNLGNINYLENGGSAYENAYTSFFGRVSYNYANRYYLQGNIRTDGSSRFHKDYRWGVFPSISAAWVISEESFMEGADFLSFLKLRASYGVLGNERIGNYPYQSIINFSESLLYNGNQVVSVPGAAQWNYAVQDITWEQTRTKNIGLDVNFFNNQLQLNFDVYQKETSNMLLELDIPGYMGYSNPSQNAGYMTTKGWELTARYNNQIGELHYTVQANVSDARSVMGDLSGVQFLGNQVKFAGSEFNEWFGYRSLGIYQTAEEIENSAVLNSGLKPGDIQYQDVSGPDGVPDGIISEYDKVLLGGSLPRFLYGANINLDYKGFDLAVGIQGVGKQTSELTANMIRPYQGSWGTIPMEIDNKYWSVYNSDEQNRAAKYPRLTNVSTTNNYAMSDFWLFNGSYFRLKNVVLGYTIPSTVSQKLALKNARVFVLATDLFSLNNYPKGWDPEVANSGYPITATVNFGVSLKF